MVFCAGHCVNLLACPAADPERVRTWLLPRHSPLVRRDGLAHRGEARSSSRRVPLIRGGSDDPGLITSVLAGGTSLCVECIAKKTGIPRREIEPVLDTIGQTLRIISGAHVLCDACRMPRKVYRLA